MKYLSEFIAWVLENAFGLSITSKVGEVIHFFIFATLEIFALMTIIILAIGLLRSFINPVKLKERLGKVGTFPSHVLASLLGAITPFCSCSSVPVFIGFIESGIPLGVTFSFLITSPIVNEAALALLWVAFGWKVAVIYSLTGILLGIIGGWLIGVFNMEHLVEEHVFAMGNDVQTLKFTGIRDRLDFAWEEVVKVISKVWKYVFIGIGIGAFIHGWTPDGIMLQYAGPDNPFAVIIGVIIGVPVYTSNVIIIPIVRTLIGKGMGVGTALSFMMAASALSLPEMIMLRKVLKTKLVSIFVAITSVGIILVGYLFNSLLTGLV